MAGPTMTPPCGRPRHNPWSYRAPSNDAHLRVSDAERSETADRLSKHFGDGRLDETEFQERLERAMHAKTRADLDGLFDDLPPEGGVPMRTRRRPRRPHGFLFLVLVVVAAIAATSFIASHIPWLVLGLVVFLLMRRHQASRQSRP